MRITEALAKGRYNKEIAPEEVRAVLAAEVERMLAPVAKPLQLEGEHRPHVILVVGVNGTGKTTTIGKLAQQLRRRGQESHAGGRRYVPRRRHRPAQDLGRAHRRGGDRARTSAPIRPGWPSTRSSGRARMAATCC